MKSLSCLAFALVAIFSSACSSMKPAEYVAGVGASTIVGPNSTGDVSPSVSVGFVGERDETTGVRGEAFLAFTRGRDEEGGTELNLDRTELGLGLRYNFTEDALRPYVGVGLLGTYVDASSDVAGDSASDFALSGYGRLGVDYRLSEGLRLGLDYRLSGGRFDLGEWEGANLAHGVASVTLGWGF